MIYPFSALPQYYFLHFILIPIRHSSPPPPLPTVAPDFGLFVRCPANLRKRNVS